MRIGIEPDYDLDKELDKVQKLMTSIEKLADNTRMIRFITIREFAKITGWSVTTVKHLYNRPDFPSCDYGKEKIAEVSAVVKYFSVPRRKTS